MEFRVLGPVEVSEGGRAIELGGPLERAVLARLALSAGHVVALDQLVDGLWDGDPPETATVAVRVRVSRIRKALGPAGSGAIRTESSGYRLSLGAGDSVDAASFEDLVNRGRRSLAGGDADEALCAFAGGLALWHGPALAGSGDGPFVRAEATRLEEARVQALEARIDAEMALGRHANLVAEIETLCTKYPLRERFWAQRMAALYRSGRQADALAAYQKLRAVLREELGLDPSPELVWLEQRILAQASDLSAPAAAPETLLPSGVVTFLLTDIEGSTELWEAYPAAMAGALATHDRLVARAVSDHGGHVIKSKGEGDATLSVFSRASDAVAAALDHRGAIEAEEWPAGIELRVRCAIHTGEAHERDGDYFGPAVNRAARIRSLARGGQIVLSHVTSELVRDRLPQGTGLVDTGERALRGLGRGEHVFELVHGGEANVARRETEIPARPPLPEPLAVALGSAFVGRALESNRLDALLKESAGGALRLAFLAGEPGIGKTRLAAEFARTAHDGGAVILYGRCDEEPSSPYQPFVEAIRRWAGTLSLPQRASVPRAEHLAHLVAELSGTAAPAPRDDPEVERYRFLEAIASTLAHASLAGPLILLLDDLHWADRPTLQLLRHIQRTRGTMPLFVLGTYRESDLARTRPFAETLADLRREHAFERIALRGLDEGEIASLLERRAAHDIGGRGRALARALSQSTEGNPFFIEQIVGNLIETGRLVQSDGRWVLDAKVDDLGIPEGVTEAIGRRLSRLSDPCNKALAAASVLGREFEVDVLIRMLARDPDEVLGAIEEALGVGLIREVKTRGHAACTFSHALVQQALYEELPLARKQRLHLKAADAIEEVHGAHVDAHVMPLARHLRAAGAAADPGKAIDYTVRAMEAARLAFAFEEAITHADAALELMDENGSEPAKRARIHERLGDLLFVAGIDYGRGTTSFDEALRLQETTGDEADLARLHLKLGRSLSTFTATLDVPLALEHLHAAERLLGPEPVIRFAAPLMLGIATASFYGLEMEAGYDAARRAMEIGQRAGAEAVWATAAAFKAWGLILQGKLDDAHTLLQEAWTVADRLDHLLAAFSATWISAYVSWRVDPRETCRLLRRELDRPRQAQAANTRQTLLSALVTALTYAGDVEEARTISEQVPAEHLRGPGIRYLGDSLGALQQRNEDLLPVLRRTGSRTIESVLLTEVHPSIRLALGDAEGARRDLEAGLKIATGKAVPSELIAHLSLAILEAGDGAIDKAREHLARGEQIVSQGNGWRGLLGDVACARGAVSAAEGRHHDADADFEDALTTFRRYGLPIREAEALQLWGSALIDAGDKPRAIEKLDTAIEMHRSRRVGEPWIEYMLVDRRRAE